MRRRPRGRDNSAAVLDLVPLDHGAPREEERWAGLRGRAVRAPLVPFVDGYRQELLRRGHAPGAVKHHLVLMGQLSRWLSGEGLGVGELTKARAEEFLCARRVGRHRRVPTLAMPSPLRGRQTHRTTRRHPDNSPTQTAA